MEGTNAIVSALSTGLSTVQGDMLDAIAAVVPTALVVAGAVAVITIGIKLFKRIAK